MSILGEMIRFFGFFYNYYYCYTRTSLVLGMMMIMCSASASASAAAKELPATFIFGDSLLEVGNNNYIVSLSKANYVPNGIDFGRPTGRYTNGRTIVDIIGQQVGLKEFTPPYLAPTTAGPMVMKGVNYASGGGGILNDTGKIFVGRINMDAQLDNFENTKQYMMSTIGGAATDKLLGRALFAIAIGSNDFINNYLTPVLSTVEQKVVSPQAFVDTLISRFTLQLTRLYKMGARKIIVANVGPIGCIPYQREINPLTAAAGHGSCVDRPNQLARMFNARLKLLLPDLTDNLDGYMLLYADVYRIVDDIVNNYLSYGFLNANSACCYGAGRYGGLIPCGPECKVCSDRSKYVFWDAYHPSDACNQIIAKRLMDGDSNDVSPTNIRRLLDS